MDGIIMTIKMISKNRKAYHNYEVIDKFEAGIQLIGTEVKSIRAGKVSLTDTYAAVQHGELLLHNMHISPYEQGNRYNHDPYRKRKLLMHKKEIIYLSVEIEKRHLTVVPLSIYIKKQWIKIEIGLCKGLKKYDKRDKIAKEDSKRQIARIMKSR